MVGNSEDKLFLQVFFTPAIVISGIVSDISNVMHIELTDLCNILLFLWLKKKRQFLDEDENNCVLFAQNKVYEWSDKMYTQA